jgi:asparagine synthetase B (glutamine-hydrolysing)
MTLIAGIISRREHPLPDSICAGLARSISRHPNDEVKAFRDRSSYFARVDIGAFAEAGFHVDSAGLSLLTGEMLLSESEITPEIVRENLRATAPNTNDRKHVSRLADLTSVHQPCLENCWKLLRRAEGTFSLVQYQPESGTLNLIADKLGVRPLYYWFDDDFVVFAGALRILEDCPLVPKKMNLRAVTELVGLGFALADRTPYAGISLLKPAEVLQITRDKTARHCYWRWDEIEVSRESEESRLASVYDCFQAAVRRRLGSDQSAAAFLSGGLDSRCIVGALRNDGVRVQTVNFARPGSQDFYFGNQFAQEIGSDHQSVPKQQGDRMPDYSLLMSQVLAHHDSGQQPGSAGIRPATREGSPASAEDAGRMPALPTARPRVVWSGEGGSQLLGHIHFNQSIVESMRAGRVDRAIDEYLEREQVHIPAKLFRQHLIENAREIIKQGMMGELSQWHAPDAGRNFYLFLVLNEQRRKLMDHFENIDQHRLEFQLPFFDARFLAAVIATPLDLCLRHEFYVKWLSQFPPAVTAVPWQAYPGHEPCPLPIPLELGYQWDDSYQAREGAVHRPRVLKQAAQLLRATDFPDQILSRRNLRLAVWIHARGWRDYRYAIEAARTYHAYARKCGGEFTVSPS